MQPEPPSLHQQIFSPNFEQATPISSMYGHGHELLLMEINRSDAAVVYNYYFEPILRLQRIHQGCTVLFQCGPVVSHSAGANVPLNS